MKRLHIIGRKNSGKTSLIVDLVKQFTAQGYRVGTIKHTHHQHELDTPGKDSHRHRQSGAHAVGILSPGMNAIFWPAQPAEDLSQRYDHFDNLLNTCDLVLVEGHSQTTTVKVEVWRAAITAAPLANADLSVAAIISDDEIPVAPNDLASNRPPVWPRQDVTKLVGKLSTLLTLAPSE